MTFFQDMADVARELLGEVGDNSGETLGEDLIVKRPAVPGAAGGYDPANRRAAPAGAAAGGAECTLRGTFESSLGGPSDTFKDSLTAKYDRVCVAIPGTGPDAFEPKMDYRLDGDGRTWRIAEVAPERRQGVPMLFIMGLEAA